jgi:hypothetical protein
MWPFHRHKYVPRFVGHGVNKRGGEITLVTSKCSCDKIDQEVYAGHLDAKLFLEYRK